MTFPPPDSLDPQRLDAARRALEETADGTIDWVIDLVAVIAPMSLRDEADVVKTKLKTALRENTAAELNHVTKLLRARDAIWADSIRSIGETLADHETRLTALELGGRGPGR